MTKILKRPLSILLALMMVVSLFAVVPITASAAEETIIINSGNDKLSNHGIQNLRDGYHSDFNDNQLSWGTFVAPTGKVFTKIVTNGVDWVRMNWTGSAERVDHDGMENLDGIPFTISFTLADAITTYTVTWKNGDTTLKTDTVDKDAIPAYSGDVPTKAADDSKHYTFSGWSNGTTTYGLNDTLPAVSADVTYTAQFTEAAHSFNSNPVFNWTQDASTGDWDCDTLTLACSCGDTQEYAATGFFGASAVTVTANDDGSFTYSVSKKVDGVTYSDTKTTAANGVVKSSKQLKAAAKKGGEWELGADLTGVTDVQCANGFVLDGNNHTVTRNANVSTQAVFRTTTNPAEVTLKNLTIDGIEGQSDSKPAVATKMSNPSDGNVINLENVTITNYDFDAANNGVVLAWGQATVNMTDCNVVTDSTYDVWGGAASKVNISGGTVGAAYLNGGSAQAAITDGATVSSITAANGSKIATDAPEKISVGEDYKLQSNGDGTYTVVPKDYVAQVGSTKYENFQDALDVTPDGGTVTVLQDITTSGNIYADGFVSGGNRTYTVDLGGYTVSGGTFIVADGNDVTFKNGTIESATYAIQNTATATIDSTATVKSTATDASAVFGAEGSTTNINGTVEGNKYSVIARGGTLNVAGKVTATNDDGRAITLNKGGAADINDGADIDGAYGVVVHKDANLNVNGGDIAGVYHAVSGNGTAADGPYTINVTGGTLTATNGAGIYNPNAQGTLNISGGSITGSTTAVAAGENSTNSISGGTFNTPVPEEYCAEGFEPTPVDPVTGMYTVARTNPLDAPITKADDGNKFGINSEYLAGTILGVQKKAKASVDAATTSDKGAQEAATGSDMRFVAVLDTETLQGADDYGFVLAKVGSDKNTTNTNFDNLKMGDDRAKTISAQNTYNNICGDERYGDPTDGTTDYKYITCSVNGVDDSSKIVARFYVVKDGKTYYAKYAGYNYQYRGVTAGLADLED